MDHLVPTFPVGSGLAGFPSPLIPRLYILLGQAQTLNILLVTVSLSLSQLTVWSRLSCSINLHRHTVLNSISIVLMYTTYQPPQSAFLDNQTDWFLAQQFSDFCFFQFKTMHLSCNLYGLVDVGEVWEYEKEAFVCLCSLKVAIVAIKIVCVCVCT